MRHAAKSSKCEQMLARGRNGRERERKKEKKILKSYVPANASSVDGLWRKLRRVRFSSLFGAAKRGKGSAVSILAERLHASLTLPETPKNCFPNAASTWKGSRPGGHRGITAIFLPKLATTFRASARIYCNYAFLIAPKIRGIYKNGLQLTVLA